MPFCPQCKTEYREGITTCADCGAALVGRLAEQEVIMSDEPMVVVYEAPDQFYSSFVKSALQQADIPVIEQVDRHPWYDNLDFSTVGRYSRLLTLESKAAKAQQVVADFLAAYERGDFALSEEAEMEAEPEE